MRRLFEKRTIIRAVSGGAFITVLCIPYVYASTADAGLRLLRIGFLLPLMIMALQIGIAWSSYGGAGRSFFVPPGKKDCLFLLLIGVGMGSCSFFCIDPLLTLIRTDFYPDSLADLLASMPWTVLFQPLLLVITPYAFAVRLTRRPATGFILVVLGQQGILLVQLQASGPAIAGGAVLFSAGVYALVKTWCFYRWGVLGPVVVVTCIQLRHIFHL